MSGTDATRLQQLIRALPRPERYTVLMFFADELTVAEISLVLNLPPSTIESILDRFRKSIGRKIADHSVDAQAISISA